MEFETIKYETDEYVGIVTLNRPEKLNALNATLRDELEQVCAQIYGTDSIRAVVITGSGKGFCSGADVTGPAPQREEAPSQNSRLDDMGWVGRLLLARLNSPVDPRYLRKPILDSIECPHTHFPILSMT